MLTISTTHAVAKGRASLPDDPGKAGKFTVEGIDSDNDGLRDDVQRFIALKYPDSELIRTMLAVYAKGLQVKIIDANDEALSVKHMQESMMLTNCIKHVRWKKNIKLLDWFNMEDEIKAEVINTDLRIKKYKIHNAHGENFTYFGGSDTGPEEAKRHCPFDPDVLPN